MTDVEHDAVHVNNIAECIFAEGDHCERVNIILWCYYTYQCHQDQHANGTALLAEMMYYFQVQHAEQLQPTLSK